VFPNTITTNLGRGGVEQLTVETANSTSYVSVWIDFDQNKAFDPITEYFEVFLAASSGTIGIPIPATAPLGQTIMRVRSRSVTTGTAGCGQFGSGETEDYIVNIGEPRLSAKVFLSSRSATTGLMDNYVATISNFPLVDPYSVAGAYNSNFTHVNNPAPATINPTILSVTGTDAIVDWVFIELRQGTSGTTTVSRTVSALVQADGDIVDVDGISPVAIPNLPAGTYYIAVRHRNHYGFRTFGQYSVGSQLLNFTNNSVLLHGSSPVTSVTPTVVLMVGGDANADGSIDAFDTIDWEIQNGLFDDYLNNADYNMDGSVDAFDTIVWEIQNGKFAELD
jgi:GEVED domain